MNRRDARISVIYHFKSVICGAAGAAPKDLRALVGNWPQICSFMDQSACLPKPNTRNRIFNVSGARPLRYATEQLSTHFSESNMMERRTKKAVCPFSNPFCHFPLPRGRREQLILSPVIDLPFGEPSLLLLHYFAIFSCPEKRINQELFNVN